MPRTPEVLTPAAARAQDAELARWITKQEAAKRLDCSVKSIERRIADGRLRTMKRPVRGQHPDTMIHPDDFAALESEKAVTTLPPAPPQRNPELEALTDSATNLVEFLNVMLREPARPPTMNLALDAAERASGLPRRLLLKAIREGRLAAHAWSGDYYIHRADLEAFRPAAQPALAWTKGAGE